MSLWTGWTSKPPQGTPIDRSHGLCNGLVSFYACNECSGGTVNDLKGNLNLTASGYGSTNPWIQGPGVGVGFADNLSGANAFATLPAAVEYGWPLTIVGGVGIIGTSAAFSTLFGVFPNATNASPFAILAFTMNSAATFIELEFANAGSLVNGTSTQAPTKGNYVLGGTITAASYSIYVNGVLNTNVGSTYSNPTYAAGANMGIGDVTASARTAHAVIYWWGWWNRVLSAAEHASIAGNPWQIFAAPLPFWFGGGVAVQDPIGVASLNAMSMP